VTILHVLEHTGSLFCPFPEHAAITGCTCEGAGGFLLHRIAAVTHVSFLVVHLATLCRPRCSFAQPLGISHMRIFSNSNYFKFRHPRRTLKHCGEQKRQRAVPYPDVARCRHQSSGLWWDRQLHLWPHSFRKNFPYV
jgi:hypothetical protein